ncbi:MAG: aspartyl protease family protein [Acetobacteraceae bacterium]
MRINHPGCMAILVASLLAARLSTAAGAENRCKLLMSPPVPVRMEGLRPVIFAEIDGVEAPFIVDTGSFFDFLSPAAVARFKLPLQYAPPWYWVRGVGGSVLPRIATARTLSVAGISAKNALFLVGDNDFEGGEVGVLGQNLFRTADIDFDLPDGVLRFVKPQHCGDAVLAYWASGQAIGEVDLHWTTSRRPQLMGKASVNGHEIEVLFDTGSPRSILSLAAAKRAGITPESPGVVPAGVTGGVGRHAIKVWNAPVAKFQIGDEAIEHTRLLIGDIDLPGLGADMLLGSDFFLAHHIYVGNSQNKLYFTYSGGPVFDLNARRAAPAGSASAISPATRPGATPQPGNSPGSGAAQGGSTTDIPTDAAGFMRRGMAETSRGQLSLAIADLTRACELAAADADCHYRRGLAYWRNRNPRLALADFNDALKLAPADYAAHLARAELQLPRLHAGIEGDLDAVDRLAPREADLRLQLARVYGSIGRYKAAAHQLDLWIQYHPQDARLFRALGLRCWARAAADAELEGALADCNRAVHVNLAASHSAFWRLTHRAAPGPGWLLSNRSLVYLRLGDLGQAIADDDAALEQIPAKESEAGAGPLYLRGLAELRKGLKSQGHADLAAARKLRPGIDDYYASMGLEH